MPGAPDYRTCKPTAKKVGADYLYNYGIRISRNAGLAEV